MAHVAYRAGALALAAKLSLAAAAHAIPRPPSAMPPAQKPDPLVRVLIGTFPKLAVSGYDLDLGGGVRLAGSSAFHLRCGVSGAGEPYVEFGAGRRAHGSLEIQAPGGFLQVNDRPYRSKLLVHPRGTSCAVVNVVRLEKYLAGVIGKEMSASWPLEALKAQAVASRSYALHQMRQARDRDYDVEGGTQDQVYEGSAYESARTHRAAESTKGMVLSLGEGALKAYFHANCGGVTEVPELVWGGEAKLFRSVECPYHKRARDRQRWSLRLSRSQIESAIRKISGRLPHGLVHVASVEAGAPYESRRLGDISLSDGHGNNLLVNANAFRNAVGNTRIKSTSFHISKAGDGYVFEGEGFGHGVGLCQVGARAMAEEGKSFEQILRFYYPLAKISGLL